LGKKSPCEQELPTGGVFLVLLLKVNVFRVIVVEKITDYSSLMAFCV